MQEVTNTEQEPVESREQSSVEAAEDRATVLQMRQLPRSVGYALTAVGIFGILTPGPVGAPFLVLGGLMLWPSAFRKPDAWLQRRLPRARHEAITIVHRFMDDLDRRYPEGDRNSPPKGAREDDPMNTEAKGTDRS